MRCVSKIEMLIQTFLYNRYSIQNTTKRSLCLVMKQLYKHISKNLTPACILYTLLNDIIYVQKFSMGVIVLVYFSLHLSQQQVKFHGEIVEHLLQVASRSMNYQLYCVFIYSLACLWIVLIYGIKLFNQHAGYVGLLYV